MSPDRAIRQAHRWISIVFTATVVVLLAAQFAGVQAEWIYMLPLAPLVLLLPTGLWLFFHPYARKRGFRASRDRAAVRPSTPSRGARGGRR